MMELTPLLLSLTAVVVMANYASAETIRFGSGSDVFEMDFVFVGQVGNEIDARTAPPMGTVDYSYEIGRHEVSCGMIEAAGRNGAAVSATCNIPEHPAAVTWLEAAQFVNWLNTSSGFLPAYKLKDESNPPSFLRRLQPWDPGDSGYDPNNPTRNSLAWFVLPTRDEWHKAAYYDPSSGGYNNYATGNDAPANISPDGGTQPNSAFYGPPFAFPLADITNAGGLSAYGTMGQTGNADEWEEGPFDPAEGFLGRRAFRNGNRALSTLDAMASRSTAGIGIPGFRVAIVPEPSIWVLCGFAVPTLLAFRKIAAV